MLTGITDTLFPHTTDIATMRRELSRLLRVRVYCTERNTHKQAALMRQVCGTVLEGAVHCHRPDLNTLVVNKAR